MGLVAPQHVEASWTRDRTHVPFIGKRILNHWTTREVPISTFLDLIIKQRFSRTFVFCFHIVKFGGLYQAIPHFHLLVFGRPEK